MALNLIVRDKDYKQNIILLGKSGEQTSHTIYCAVAIGKEVHNILYLRTIVYQNNNYRLLRYSEKQDILFYKIVDAW